MQVALQPSLSAELPVLLGLASAIATITRHHIAIITLLDAALVVDTVAAALGELGHAPGGAGAIAQARRTSRSTGRGSRGVELDGQPTATAGAGITTATADLACSARTLTTLDGNVSASDPRQ